jgi:hypothetical protein
MSRAADAISKALGKSGGLFPVVNRPPVAAASVSTPDEQPVAACEPEQQDLQLQSDGVADDRVELVDADLVDQIEESSVIAATLADASETERIAALDRARHEIDRAANRGYDYDPTAPSHAEFMERQRDLERQQVAQHHERVAETHLRLDRLAVLQSASQLKAMELIRTCREHGIGLRLDPDGALVVVSNGAAWRSLVNDIELHIDSVADLIMAGWDSMDA